MSGGPPLPSFRPEPAWRTPCSTCAPTANRPRSSPPITKAVQRRLTTPAHLLTALRTRHAVRYRHLIEQVLGDAESGVHSQLECRFNRDVARLHGLPPGRRQFRVPGTNRLADVSYEEFKLLVELDGRIGHVEEGMWRDRKQDNAHAMVGWLTLRFGWRVGPSPRWVPHRAFIQRFPKQWCTGAPASSGIWKVRVLPTTSGGFA